MSLFGRIEDISIVDVLQMVHLGQRSGTLFVWQEPRRAAIVFESGRITRVWSTDYNRLSEMLRAQGLLSDRDLLSAFRTQTREPEPRRLHEIMLSLGLITAAALESAVERHIARLIREVTGWTRGSFELTQEARLVEPIGSAAALDTIPASQLSVEYMLLEAARVTDETSQPIAVRAAPVARTESGSARPGGATYSSTTTGTTSDLAGVDQRWAGVRSPFSTEDLSSLLPEDPTPRRRPLAALAPTSPIKAAPPPRAASGRAASVPGTPRPRAASTPVPAPREASSINSLKDRSSEQEVSRLMSLYVATYQLHASLDPAEVQRAISDVTINLVGAEQFVLLLRDEFGTALLVEIAEGAGARAKPYDLGEYIGGEPLLDEALLDGKLRVSPDPQARLRAVMPLEFQGETVGALVILKMLPHKRIFEDEDRELLHLVSVHAASAMYAARLFTRTDCKLKTLESLLHLLRSDAVRAREQERAAAAAAHPD